MDYKILNKPSRRTKKTSQILERISYIEETNDDNHHTEIALLHAEIQQLKDFNWILLDKIDSQYRELQSLLQDLHSSPKELPTTAKSDETKQTDTNTDSKENLKFQKLESQLYAQQLMIEDLDNKILKELKSLRGQQLLHSTEERKKQSKKWFQFWK